MPIYDYLWPSALNHTKSRTRLHGFPAPAWWRQVVWYPQAPLKWSNGCHGENTKEWPTKCGEKNQMAHKNQRMAKTAKNGQKPPNMINMFTMSEKQIFHEAAHWPIANWQGTRISYRRTSMPQACAATFTACTMACCRSHQVPWSGP